MLSEMVIVVDVNNTLVRRRMVFGVTAGARSDIVESMPVLLADHVSEQVLKRPSFPEMSKYAP